jgi:hypothetical protein
MLHRSVALLSLTSLLFVGACGDKDDVNGVVQSNATVRFINATGSNIDVTNAGTVGTGNGNLGYGTSSTCMSVNTNGSSGSGLGFNQAGTSTTIPGFTQNFASAGNYSVIAYPDANGTTQFATINNAGFTPNSGQAGLRVFNAASGSGNLVALGGGTALGSGTGVGFGTGGSFMNVNAGSQAVTFNTGTGTTTAANAGTLTFNAGQNYTLVVAPAASGSTALRTFLVSGC